jgi:molecular chaperone GrpE (heat shock protein)
MSDEPTREPAGEDEEFLGRQLRLAQEEIAETRRAHEALQAENEEYRDQVGEEVKTRYEAKRDRLLLRLVEMIERLEATIDSAEHGTTSRSFVEGLALVRTLALKTGTEEGLELVPVSGGRLDPELCDVVAERPVDDEEQVGRILEERAPALRMGQTVARKARVVVGVAAVAEESPDLGLEGALIESRRPEHEPAVLDLSSQGEPDEIAPEVRDVAPDEVAHEEVAHEEVAHEAAHEEAALAPAAHEAADLAAAEEPAASPEPGEPVGPPSTEETAPEDRDGAKAVAAAGTGSDAESAGLPDAPAGTVGGERDESAEEPTAEAEAEPDGAALLAGLEPEPVGADEASSTAPGAAEPEPPAPDAEGPEPETDVAEPEPGLPVGPGAVLASGRPPAAPEPVPDARPAGALQDLEADSALSETQLPDREREGDAPSGAPEGERPDRVKRQAPVKIALVVPPRPEREAAPADGSSEVDATPRPERGAETGGAEKQEEAVARGARAPGDASEVEPADVSIPAEVPSDHAEREEWDAPLVDSRGEEMESERGEVSAAAPDALRSEPAASEEPVEPPATAVPEEKPWSWPGSVAGAPRGPADPGAAAAEAASADARPPESPARPRQTPEPATDPGARVARAAVPAPDATTPPGQEAATRTPRPRARSAGPEPLLGQSQPPSGGRGWVLPVVGAAIVAAGLVAYWRVAVRGPDVTSVPVATPAPPREPGAAEPLPAPAVGEGLPPDPGTSPTPVEEVDDLGLEIEPEELFGAADAPAPPAEAPESEAVAAPATPTPTPRPPPTAATPAPTVAGPVTAPPPPPAAAATPSRVEEILSRAADARGRDDLKGAGELYAQALELEPQNAAALAGRRAVEAALQPRRRFVPGRTVVKTRESESTPAGFDTGDVAVAEAPRNFGDLSFEMDPVSPRPGEPYSIKVFISNTGRRKLKTQSVSLVQTVDGETKPEVWAPEIELGPGERALLKELSGDWPEATRTWRLQVTVQTGSGDKLECRLSWR